MWIYGISGFFGGFVAGMIINAVLLRNIPKSEYINNKKLRMRYGALNWAIALIGLFLALSYGETRL